MPNFKMQLVPYELTKSSIVHETNITIVTLSNNGEISHTFFQKMVQKFT